VHPALGEKYFEQQYTVLDVGCGSNPSGDVNCDLFLKDVGHRFSQKGRELDIKKIPNFVLCDSQYLPFKNDAFDEVYSRHVIEHVKDPVLFLDETVRVSKDKVTIFCPFWLGDRFFGGSDIGHISFFNKKWFFRYLSSRRLFGLVRYSRSKSFLIFFSVPSELHVIIRKLLKH